MKKNLLLICLLFLQLIVTIGSGSSIAYGLGKDKAPTGLTLWGKDLSGLNQTNALEVLELEIPKEVIYKDRIFPLDTTQSRVLLKKWLDRHYPPTQGVWIINALINIGNLANPRGDLSPFTLNRDEIVSQLEKLKSQVEAKPLPASIVNQNGKLVRQLGQLGTELDVEATWQKILHSNNGKPVALVVKAIEIHPDTKDINSIQSILGDYTTYFSPQDLARTNNIKLAANALDGILIAPGADFSFNKVVGYRTAATGYQKANIISGEQFVLGDGGGVCQNSGTLYQAVLQAHLVVLERNSHSLPVTYLPKDADATVVYDSLDFRFQNDSKGYLLISAHTGSNWLRIQLFGSIDETHPALVRRGGYPIINHEDVNNPK
ncbi:MAG: VanW family protein [Desulfitobacteriaceae bacterium]